jgi:hypothetical protein
MALEFRKNKDQPLPVPTNPMPPPPRLSQKAALVADEMERLEAELDAAHKYGQEQANRAEVAERLIVELRQEYQHRAEEDAHELARTRDDRDKFQRETIVLATRNANFTRELLALAQALQSGTPAIPVPVDTEKLTQALAEPPQQ